MSSSDSKPNNLRLFLFVVAAALAVRLAPMLFEIQLGRDITDYRNIALNLGRGRGYTLDIKWLHIYDTPASHFAGYDRPPLLPFYLAGLHFILSPVNAGRIAGTLLFMGLLFFVFDLVRRLVGSRAALAAGLLFAVQSALLEITLTPLTESLTITFVAGALWAWIGRRSAPLAGFFCALACLARPNSLLFTFVLGLMILGEALPRFAGSLNPASPAVDRKATLRNAALFAAFVGIGPLCFMILNVVNGAPLLLKPQSFLFRVLDFRHQLSFMHKAPAYDSAFQLIAAHPREVLYQVFRNGYHYMRVLTDGIEGLGIVLPLLPLAAWEAWRRRELRPLLILPVMAAVDLAFFVSCWATIDTSRFLCIPYVTLLILIGAGGWSALQRVAEGQGRWAAWTPLLVFGAVALMWGGHDLYRGASAWNKWRHGHGFSANLDALWNTDDVRAIQREFVKLRTDGVFKTGDVIGTDEPWLANTLTDHPAAVIPFDLRTDEWIGFLDRYKAKVMMIHAANWPAENHAQLQDLMDTLNRAGWRKVAIHGPLGLWLRPE